MPKNIYVYQKTGMQYEVQIGQELDRKIEAQQLDEEQLRAVLVRLGCKQEKIEDIFRQLKNPPNYSTQVTIE